MGDKQRAWERALAQDALALVGWLGDHMVHQEEAVVARDLALPSMLVGEAHSGVGWMVDGHLAGVRILEDMSAIHPRRYHARWVTHEVPREVACDSS